MQLYTLHFESIPSTNRWAKKYAPLLDQQGLTRISATHQTAPYGRHARAWVSLPNQSLSCSYFFSLSTEQREISTLTQVCALIVRSVLKKAGLHAKIKWPNDLLVEGKKISGILTELVDLGAYIGAICGIGINVNMEKSALMTIEQQATSLLEELGHPFPIDRLQEELDSLILVGIELYRKEGFTPFYPEYEEHLLYKGSLIKVKEDSGDVSGILHSIAPDGRLHLLLPSGDIRTLSSGEMHAEKEQDGL